MLHDPKNSGPGRIEELQLLDGPDITRETPVRFWTRHQFTGDERSTTEYYRRSVGNTRGDRQSTKGQDRDEDQDSDYHQHVTNDGLTVDVHAVDVHSLLAPLTSWSKDGSMLAYLLFSQLPGLGHDECPDGF